jgi:hypothetical protein
MIQMIVEIPTYTPSQGFTYQWEDGFVIQASVENGVTLIQANKAGLISLANHLLNLAQDGIPPGVHLHLDDLNSLEESSSELVIEKMQ